MIKPISKNVVPPNVPSSRKKCNSSDTLKINDQKIINNQKLKENTK